MQHLVSHSREQPVLQLRVSSVPLGIGIEMGRAVHLNCDRSILSRGHVAMLVCQRPTQAHSELLEDGIFLLFFLLCQNLLLPIQ